LSQPFLSLGVGKDLSETIGNNLSNWLGISLSLLSGWIGNDGLVDLLVDIFAGLGTVGLEALIPLGEEALIFFGILLLEGVHV